MQDEIYPTFSVTREGVVVDGLPLTKSLRSVLSEAKLRQVERIEELLKQVKPEEWDNPQLFRGAEYSPLVRASMMAALLSPQPWPLPVRKYNPYHLGPGPGGGQFTTADMDGQSLPSGAVGSGVKPTIDPGSAGVSVAENGSSPVDAADFPGSPRISHTNPRPSPSLHDNNSAHGPIGRIVTVHFKNKSTNVSNDALSSAQTAAKLIQDALKNGTVPLSGRKLYPKLSSIDIELVDGLKENVDSKDPNKKEIAHGYTSNNHTAHPTIQINSSLKSDEMSFVMSHELTHVRLPDVSGWRAGSPINVKDGLKLHDIMSMYSTGKDQYGTDVFGGMYRQSIENELKFRQGELETARAVGLKPDPYDQERIDTLENALRAPFYSNGAPVNNTKPYERPKD